MQKYQIVFTKTALKDIQKINPQTVVRIKKKTLFFIESNKPLSFAERLTKPADAEYRWRVGDYRILFDESDNIVMVLRVQHRREVYR